MVKTTIKNAKKPNVSNLKPMPKKWSKEFVAGYAFAIRDSLTFLQLKGTTRRELFELVDWLTFRAEQHAADRGRP